MKSKLHFFFLVKVTLFLHLYLIDDANVRRKNRIDIYMQPDQAELSHTLALVQIGFQICLQRQYIELSETDKPCPNTTFHYKVVLNYLPEKNKYYTKELHTRSI